MKKTPPTMEMYKEYALSVGVERQRLEAELVAANMGLVITVVNKMAGVGRVPNEVRQDWEQAATIGLLIGLRKYDPDRGFKFSTYAYNWIVQSIQYERNKSQPGLRLPRSIDQAIRAKMNAEVELTPEEGEMVRISRTRMMSTDIEPDIDHVPLQVPADPDPDLDRTDDEDAVHRAWALARDVGLPELWDRATTLSMGGMPTWKIAEALGVSHWTAWSSVTRGVHALAVAMGEAPPDIAHKKVSTPELRALVAKIRERLAVTEVGR